MRRVPKRLKGMVQSLGEVRPGGGKAAPEGV
jgi:hypothetical protein